jgi:hypothetical protein
MEAFAAQLPQLEVLAERLYNSTVSCWDGEPLVGAAFADHFC